MSFNQPPPPPPPGGTPPPPPGGYGGPPPPQQPQQPYGAGGSSQWDLGAALSYGWSKFQANTAQLVIATLAILGGAIVIGVVYFVVNSAMSPDYVCDSDALFDCHYEDGAPFLVRFPISILLSMLFFVYAQVVGSGIIRGALGITEGREFQAAQVFKFDNIGPVLVTSLIVGAATFVGMILCIIPGIIVAFLTSYSLFFVVDKNMAPMDAIKASIDLTKNNLGQTIVWYIIGGIIAELGFVICGVGALVSVPVVIIGTAYTYKKLTGQQVAA
jgi:uncharacterized membrane protein